MSGASDVSATPPPLILVKQDATPEEVAALTAVLGLVAASSGAAEAEPRRQWGAPYRMVRPALVPSPGGWKASALPR